VYSPTSHQAHNPNNYGSTLMGALPQAIAPNPHANLLNVYVYRLQIKWGFNKKKKRSFSKVPACVSCYFPRN
jgi:hypothetical protein